MNWGGGYETFLNRFGNNKPHFFLHKLLICIKKKSFLLIQVFFPAIKEIALKETLKRELKTTFQNSKLIF